MRSLIIFASWNMETSMESLINLHSHSFLKTLERVECSNFGFLGMILSTSQTSISLLFAIVSISYLKTNNTALIVHIIVKQTWFYVYDFCKNPLKPFLFLYIWLDGLLHYSFARFSLLLANYYSTYVRNYKNSEHEGTVGNLSYEVFIDRMCVISEILVALNHSNVVSSVRYY